MFEMEFERNSFSPEGELLAAVILRAVQDLVTPAVMTDEATVRSARRWLFSNEEDEFSFLWVCDQLKLKEIGRIRRFARENALDPDDPKRRAIFRRRK